ncbi:hypothetical protein NQZ79_g7089 [Umbelopsis isabellina]|nr:hypothetical protein NQZ79_g7089 [Umbelopsis isabellina]
MHSCHQNICLAFVVASFLATTWAQSSNGPTVSCGEPATDTTKTPTITCCSQANGLVVRNPQGQISGCVIADYSQAAVASAFQSCCSQQMVVYSAVGKQAPDDSTGM